MALWKLPIPGKSLWERGPLCGAEMKTGLLLPDPPKCTRLPGHLGDHEASTVIRWPRTGEEVAEILAQLDGPGAPGL